jgi:xanthine dehydrogenase/oxidase
VVWTDPHCVVMMHSARATKTEALLQGMNWAQTATLKQAIASLGAELRPQGPDANYRHQLMGSLFYKFWVETLAIHNVPLPAQQLSAGVPFVRGVSTSTEDFSAGTCPAVPKMQSHRQAAGEARYSDDNVPAVNCLWAAFVPSTVASGSLGAVDPNAALSMPGVVDYLDASDLASSANCTPLCTTREGCEQPRKIFSGTTIDYHGQPIGAILATSRAAADAAVAAVKVSYTGVCAQPVVNIDAAIKAGGKYVSPAMKPSYGGGQPKSATVIRGDVQKAFAQAAFTGTGELNIAGQYHFHMETQTCVATPTQADGLVLHCACQAPSLIQTAVAKATQLPQNKVLVETVRVGGAFGGKTSNAVPTATVAAIGAHKHRRECRMQMSLKENMQSAGKRSPFKLTYKVACGKDGVILAVSGTVYAENWECPCDFSEDYDVENWHVNGTSPRTCGGKPSTSRFAWK